MKEVRKLTIGAVMVSLAVVLTLLSKLIPAPYWLQGGSITLASAVPIIAVGIICGTKWGILSSLVFSIIQIMTGFYPPPTQTLLYFVLVILLDYVIAFGVYGLGGTFYKLMNKKTWAIPVSGAIVVTLRYVCHILSGILIWGVYAPKGEAVWIYSIVYNGSYMVPEIIINTVVLIVLSKLIKKYAAID
ncbi:MAG: energy-coupled thiamine transporter ThiT [Bacillota bacterium]|nr:energy-coupled thiamine transporter ThiT [Bacillota bacterium]